MREEVRMSGMPVLIVSSDTAIRDELRGFLVKSDVDPWEVDDAERGLVVVRRRPLDAVIVGPDVLRGGAMRSIAAIRAFDEQIAVIAVVDAADAGRTALAAGAYDFFLKPIDLDRLGVVLRHVAETAETRVCSDLLACVLHGPARLGALVAQDPEMIKVFTFARRLARYESPLLLSGEAGTGKESLARELHALGRPAGSFVVLKAAGATPEDLEQASSLAAGGTLFVDDVLALGPEAAAAVVGWLDRRGDARGEPRVVAACRDDATRRLSPGTAQEDLYLRLAETTLHLPPLRERQSDILLIAREVLRTLRNGTTPEIGLETSEVLMGYAWPGNVDELKSALEVGTAAGGATITTGDLPPPLRRGRLSETPRVQGESRRLADIEAAHLRQAIAETGGNKARAARILGLSRWALQRKLQKHHISTEESHSP
jgi:DNA-binding NtrC family response regulator